MASAGGGNCKTGTELEQLIARLMAVDGDPASPCWHDPIILCTKELALQRPLTSLHSDDLQRKALEMFRVRDLFLFAVFIGDRVVCEDRQYVESLLLMSSAVTVVLFGSPVLGV